MLQMITPYTAKEKGTEEKVRRARRKLDYCIYGIKTKLREMVFALAILEPVAIWQKLPLMTNGKELYYSPEYVLETDKERLQKEILHITLHGLLGHFEEEEHMADRELAWAVMDRKVERLTRFFLGGIGDRDSKLPESTSGRETMGMELYYRAKKNKGLREKVIRQGESFVCDDHNFWHMQPLCLKSGIAAGNGEADPLAAWKNAREMMKELLGVQADQGAETDLEKLLARMTGKNAYGFEAGSGVLEIEACAGEPADYGSILGQLQRLGTVCGEEDIPDPIYYCYGLEMYGDVPLVEPLEEAEKISLDTLIVAVDTSGSCINQLPDFLRETRALLDQLAESIEVKRIWYLECDAKIQNEGIYEGDAIRNAFIEEHSYDGGGGTDFRPVFERIAEYESEGGAVSGLLYYSDGQGQFPVEAPDYPCYFILPGDAYEWESLPDWVERLTLDA